MKKVSLKEIASLVGASPSTVSFVLNGKGKQMRISEILEKKIKEVARKEGYHPNQVAVSLRTGQSKILGLIVESIGGHFFGSLARVIEEEAEKFGYRIIYCSTENNADKGRDMIRMLSQSQVDGYLITPVEGMEGDIKALLKQEKPLVLIDGYYPKISAPYVLVDNAAGVSKGMKHLISKGYRNIAFVTVQMDLVQLNERQEAYIAELKKHKLPVSKKLIFKLPYNYDKQAGAEALCGFIKRHPDLDAIFFATNYLGITGLQSIRKLNLRIPEDIAVICFDDHDIFSLYPPGIDSLQQPVEEIAITAIHLLLKQLGKNTIKTKSTGIQVKGSFVIRGSS